MGFRFFFLFDIIAFTNSNIKCFMNLFQIENCFALNETKNLDWFLSLESSTIINTTAPSCKSSFRLNRLRTFSFHSSFSIKLFWYPEYYLATTPSTTAVATTTSEYMWIKSQYSKIFKAILYCLMFNNIILQKTVFAWSPRKRKIIFTPEKQKLATIFDVVSLSKMAHFKK